MTVDLNKVGEVTVEREMNVHIIDPKTQMMVKTVRLEQVKEFHPELNEKDTEAVNKDFKPTWEKIENPNAYGLAVLPVGAFWYKTKIMDKRFYTKTPEMGLSPILPEADSTLKKMKVKDEK